MDPMKTGTEIMNGIKVVENRIQCKDLTSMAIKLRDV
jgi:hypothetical protein